MDTKKNHFFHFLITHALYLLFLIPLLGLGALSAHIWHLLKLNLAPVLACTSFLVFLGNFYSKNMPRNVYLVDFGCYKPKPELLGSTERYIERSRQINIFTEESLSFQKKVLERSGLGQKTYIPESIMGVNAKPSLDEVRKDAEAAIFGCIDEVLDKTGVKSEDVGIVVVNSSVFDPAPSLSAMIVRRYKLVSTVKSFNLGGMGCSAGLISIDLAKHLLQASPNCYAPVVSTEIQSLNWYLGNDRSMLMSNCIFWLGGAAVLLSNRPSDRRRSKYQLMRTVRTHTGAHDNSHSCVSLKEDGDGRVGVALSKDLMEMAGEALKTNITTLGPLVLPISEQLLFFLTVVARKVFKMKKVKPYIPDFKLAFEHFCIHAGGKAVLDAIEKNLELSEWHMEPSRMTLYRFGNTSSSSLCLTPPLRRFRLLASASANCVLAGGIPASRRLRITVLPSPSRRRSANWNSGRLTSASLRTAKCGDLGFSANCGDLASASATSSATARRRRSTLTTASLLNA